MTVKKSEAKFFLQAIELELASGRIESAKSDARCLLGLAIGRNQPVLPHEDIEALDAAAKDRLGALVKRRLAGEPVSRIRGWREFWSLKFALSPATLDPRPDSETLVAAACHWARSYNPAPRCLDLGTGSGCLLLAFLSEIGAAQGIGLDLNAEAIDIAWVNAKNLGLADRAVFQVQDFTKNLVKLGQFSVVLANPPYIPVSEIADLAPDVRVFDPLLALDGGDDGLFVWRRLIPQIARVLAPDGTAFVEIGKGQEQEVSLIALASGLECVAQFDDLAGVTRCLQFAIKI